MKCFDFLSRLYASNSLTEVEKLYLNSWNLAFKDKTMASEFVTYRNQQVIYWFAYITFWGTLHQLWQGLIEMQSLSTVQIRPNNTLNDYIVHTGCDLLMLGFALFSIRFPSMQSFLGIWCWTMYLCYHAAIALLEKYTFTQIRLLAGDLQVYGVMLSLLVNSNYWFTESCMMLAGFSIWIYFISSASILNAIALCSSFNLAPDSEDHTNCVNSFGSNPALFTIKQTIIFAFYLFIARRSFENKERRLYLRGKVIQKQQQQLLYILNVMPDAVLVIKPDTFQVMFSNSKAKEMLNTEQNAINPYDEIKTLVLQDYIFLAVEKHPLLKSYL